jgi:L-ascorbate metabolism protein UlaG (beta-lactamase superfamily)
MAIPLMGTDNKDSKNNTGPSKDSLGFEYDTFVIDKTELKITFLGHATLMFTYGDKVIHVDPVSAYADYSRLPKADIILVTHSHFDHLDPAAIAKIRKNSTVIIANPESAKQVSGALAMKNGETKSVAGFSIEAVPAYNTTTGRDVFHPKGRDNGYVLTLGGKRIYISGDTEPGAEMKSLKNVFIAFLSMNQPYTMTPRQAADAAIIIKPEILYPYHFGDTKTDELTDLLKNEKGIDVRIRKLN